MEAPLPLTSTPPVPSSPTATTDSQTPPSLTLYHHPLSPFARKCWLTALEHNITPHITLHQVVVAPVEKPKAYPGWSENNDFLGKLNPIAKIPTLAVRDDDDEFAVYDSKIICEYLVDFASKWGGAGQGSSSNGVAAGTKDASYWKRQSLHRCADQMMDSEILVAYEERMREAEGIKWDAWIAGMRKKIERGVSVLRDAAGSGLLPTREGNSDAVLAGAEIAVACCLGFLDARSISWRLEGEAGKEDALLLWFEGVQGRESWKAAKADAKWVGKEA